MTTHLAILTLTALAGASGFAQNVQEDPQPDRILEVIEEFNNRDREGANEVTVVLDDSEDEASAPIAKVVEEEPADPVLVSGSPPEEAELAEDVPVEEVTPEEEPPAPETGLAVRVEKLQTGEGTLDASQVKLLAPFPAKPIAPAPAGWLLDASDSAPPFIREVEISPGSKITLTIRPHVLIPDADGAEVFSVSEPGYEASLGYQQAATVSSILATSVAQLETDSMNLGVAIDQLQQLLISLPKPETELETELETEPKTRPKS